MTDQNQPELEEWRAGLRKALMDFAVAVDEQEIDMDNHESEYTQVAYLVSSGWDLHIPARPDRQPFLAKIAGNTDNVCNIRTVEVSRRVASDLVINNRMIAAATYGDGQETARIFRTTKWPTKEQSYPMESTKAARWQN